MKDFLYNFKEAMKKGILLWILAHLILYVICVLNNDMSVYNNQIQKLYDIGNFISQLVYAGLLYSALEVTFKFFVDNIFKFSVRGEKKKVATNAIITMAMLIIVCVSVYYMKVTDIVYKGVVKIMIALISLKAIYGVATTVRENLVYNTKLEEKNREK